MRRSKNHKKPWTGKIYTIFMMFFISIIGFRLYNLFHLYGQQSHQIQRIEQQIQKQKEEQILLRSEKEYTQSDLYTEKIAREKLGLVKPNEIIFINRTNP